MLRHQSHRRLEASFIRRASTQPRPRSKRWRNAAIAVTAIGISGYTIDRTLYASGLRRSFRTGWNALCIAIDYKLHFNKDNIDGIAAMHERVARRIHHICTANGGLYIKLGQSIGIQAAILPKPYRDAFATIFDAAPQITYEEVEAVFKDQFGVLPTDAFEHFDHEALASASIAQVHRARTKDGKEVAVKVQKPAIRKQMEFDLFSYKALMWTYEKIFDIPAYFVADYVANQLRREVDFMEEARNAEKTAKFLDDEPSLKGRIVIPRVDWQWTSERVMTADFYKGCKLTDTQAIEDMHLKPKEIMDSVLDIFSAMTFKWGWIHCDPHPGNVLVRQNPDHAKRAQIVLIDHGLYIPLREEFREQYSEFWRSLFVMDMDTIERITKSWGVGDSSMMATATLLKPTRLSRKQPGKKTLQETRSEYEAQLNIKEKLKSMLENEQLIPRELIFLTRTMRMCQANNQRLGSPSNRINILAHWAAVGVESTSKLSHQSLREMGLRTYANEKLRLWRFRLALVVIDIGFLLTKVRQWSYGAVRGKQEGFEDLLARQVKDMAADTFGVEIDESAFTG
ncbi:uncharacterized protein L969DRAFT_52271 [Mixia osmundae IAM 14324]|uniref:ABC1 atypical kinase-like domain-containing protein n=1 Tax=Mixia osmundae (strain CBS 9802 / IAM 14324 / JCM 22182 / KY 12970) TaxID=764103 RepID=G7E4T2_MIXOS|nr:uncharacterized protein L969DRAFT_52271 [Mixia osmundae IAM 14324]KEI37662.1 hypothetical protein L969DRAFT_52271 [Mixia osmundae IAM 14324]GAA97842.1 hypothetical protein E5Q_04521 [Mixia osmundae IAM 14324]